MPRPRQDIYLYGQENSDSSDQIHQQVNQDTSQSNQDASQVNHDLNPEEQNDHDRHTAQQGYQNPVEETTETPIQTPNNTHTEQQTTSTEPVVPIILKNGQRIELKENGKCVNEVGSYKCECEKGYNGTHCENDINECNLKEKPCNVGKCNDGIGDFTCDCSETGFDGEHCENNIPDCQDDSCNNHGDCQDLVKNFNIGYHILAII